MVILGNINLFVADVERSVAFYTNLVGLIKNEERSHPPGFALLEAGGCTLTLQDGSAPGAVLGSAQSIELGFVVENVDAVHKRLRDAGTFVSDLQQMGWGGGFDAHDPDSNRLTFYRMNPNE